MICLLFILRSTPTDVNQTTAELEFSFYVFQSFKLHNIRNLSYVHIPGYTRLYELRFICTIELIDHIQLSTRIKDKKLREAKLRLVINTDIKDISSVEQSLKRVTPAQDTKFKCVGYG